MTTAQTTSVSLTGSWVADLDHTELSFKVRHMGVGKAGGTIPLREATLSFGEDGIPSGVVRAVADAAGVDTKNEQRNTHVRSADFLDTENYPTITFQSTGVREFDGEEFLLDGDLTVRDVTKPVTLRAEFIGVGLDAYGLPRAGFAATGSINRKDFGVNFSAAFGVSNAVVSDKVDLSIEAEFTQA